MSGLGEVETRRIASRLGAAPSQAEVETRERAETQADARLGNALRARQMPRPRAAPESADVVSTCGEGRPHAGHARPAPVGRRARPSSGLEVKRATPDRSGGRPGVGRPRDPDPQARGPRPDSARAGNGAGREERPGRGGRGGARKVRGARPGRRRGVRAAVGGVAADAGGIGRGWRCVASSAGKGVERDTIDDVLSAVSTEDELDGGAGVRREGLERMSGLDPAVRRRRLADRLARRGFGYGVISRVLKDMGRGIEAAARVCLTRRWAAT